MTGAAPVFSDRETAWHRNARFQFVPWVARLLDNGPLRGKSEPLPTGNPACLTEGTVDAVREMMNLAVWRFLARDCGWRRCFAVRSSTRAGENSFSRRRLWEGESENELPPLEFTDESIDLLLEVYNRTRNEAAVEAMNPPPCADANGDLLLHHVVFRRLTAASQALGFRKDFHWAAWQSNPLNALFQVTAFDRSASPKPDWDRLAEPDVAAFFPWIGARTTAGWLSRRDLIWDSFDSAARWFGGLSALTEAGFESLSGRPDLLIFLFDSLASQAKTAAADLERWESLADSLERRQRERVTIPWANFLKAADSLRSIHRKCVDLHPIERSGPEKCFLAAWEEMTFSEVADSLKQLRHRIRPALS